MNENWQIAIFVALAGAIVTVAGGVIAFAFQTTGRLSRVEQSVEFLIDATGRLAAKKLHSPDDHLGIDKYLDIYIHHNHDMSIQDWQELKDHCLGSRSNPSATRNEKAYAEFLIELCEHKMIFSGKTHTKALIENPKTQNENQH